MFRMRRDWHSIFFTGHLQARVGIKQVKTCTAKQMRNSLVDGMTYFFRWKWSTSWFKELHHETFRRNGCPTSLSGWGPWGNRCLAAGKRFWVFELRDAKAMLKISSPLNLFGWGLADMDLHSFLPASCISLVPEWSCADDSTVMSLQWAANSSSMIFVQYQSACQRSREALDKHVQICSEQFSNDSASELDGDKRGPTLRCYVYI